MAQLRTPATPHLHRFASGCRTGAVSALIVGLAVLSGTRFFDCFRAASCFLHSRKSSSLSALRLDQEIQLNKERFYVFVRSSHP